MTMNNAILKKKPVARSGGRRDRGTNRGLLIALATVGTLLAAVASAKDPDNGIALGGAPLFLTSQSKPNVMIELDTSANLDAQLTDGSGRQDVHYGTMADFVLDRAYVPTHKYPDLGTGSPTLDISVIYYTDATDFFHWESKALKVPRDFGLTTPGILTTPYPDQYLNYLFSEYGDTQSAYFPGIDRNAENYADVSDLIPGGKKIESARWIVRDLVDENGQGVGFGITSFNGKWGGLGLALGHGGSPWVATDESDSAAKVHAFVDNYLTTGKLALVRAPLAESLYEITRYFRGLSPDQGVKRTSAEEIKKAFDEFFTGSSDPGNSTIEDGHYKSPVKNSCQNNYVVAVTDGHTTMDDDFPGSDPDDPDGKLPNWDGKDPDNGDAPGNSAFPRYSDGGGGYSNRTDEDLLFDDIAKFAYDTGVCAADATPKNACKDRNPLYTYVIGFSDHNQMLEDAAEYGHGAFVHYQDAERLGHVWQEVLNADIKRADNSATDLASNASDPRRGRTLYQATFDSEIWAGHLRAINAGGNTDPSQEQIDTAAGTIWDAAQKLSSQDPEDRDIYTSNGDDLLKFKWSDLTADQKTALKSNPREYKWANLTDDDKSYDDGTSRQHLEDNPIETDDDYHETEAVGKARLAYLRGERALALPDGRMLRRRYRSDASACDDSNGNNAGYCNVLGDMVHSRPVYAGAPQNLTLGNGYQAFRAKHMGDTPLVYVGANDGMLHAFNADTGTERFAYVPNAVFGKLNHLTSPLSIGLHKYFVDGQQTIHPAYFNGSWHSVLVGTLGRGGRGVYALDVTGGKLTDVLWEFTADDHTDLGYTIGDASIIKIGSHWYAVFGNGYNSDNEHAVLFVVNIQTGDLAAKIDTDVGDNNGLASPAVVDRYGDKSADYIYAGDLHGNLWKFDATHGMGGLVANRFFVAKRKGHAQPITEQPEVGNDPDGGIFVYFGTGKFLEKKDYFADGEAGTQSLYGIRDRAGHDGNSFTTDINLRREELLEQTLITASATTKASGGRPALPLGTVSANDLTTDEDDGEIDHGWYLDLAVNGERQVTQPVLRAKNRIVFTTKTPSTTCGTDGQTRLYDLDSLTGGRPDYSPFDVNFDGEFDKHDFIRVDGQAMPAAMRTISGLGLSGQPIIISNGDGTETKYLNGSRGRIKQINEKSTDPHLSWQQIQ